MTHQPGPSPWVSRFASLISHGGPVLDVACGSGRHTRLLLDLGHEVVAIDRDISGISDLGDHPRLEVRQVDLEDSRPFPQIDRRVAGVVCTNYLHRPLLPALVEVIMPGGVLIYETFARGQEQFGRPTNPDYLLRPGELLDTVRGHLTVKAYEDLIVETPRPAAVQRIVAVRGW